jgi:multimeric flavodoxin WrbA
MKRLLIVWHTRTGAARQMAQAAADGASEQTQVDVRLLAAADATSDDLLAADGYLFCAPENLGSLSGEMKAFFDRTYYPVLDHLAGRPYALMVAAGSDGSGVVRQVSRIVTGWRLRSVAEPLIVCTHAQTQDAILAPKTLDAADAARCFELGQSLAEGLALGVF